MAIFRLSPALRTQKVYKLCEINRVCILNRVLHRLRWASYTRFQHVVLSLRKNTTVSNMQLTMSKFIVSSVVAIAGFATFANAANCSSQSGCKQCETNGSVWVTPSQMRLCLELIDLSRLNFAISYCGNWQNPGFATWGWASASATGPFKSQSDCLTAFDDIISQCYGNNDGGDYQYDNTLTVYFCACEIA